MLSLSMTRDQFVAAGTALESQQGIVLTGDSGSISKDGVSATYSYNGASLIVTITKKPFLVTEAYCESRLRAWLTTL